MLIFEWFGESNSEEIHLSICEVLNWVKIQHEWILNLSRQEKNIFLALFISCDLRCFLFDESEGVHPAFVPPPSPLTHHMLKLL